MRRARAAVSLLPRGIGGQRQDLAAQALEARFGLIVDEVIALTEETVVEARNIIPRERAQRRWEEITLLPNHVLALQVDELAEARGESSIRAVAASNRIAKRLAQSLRALREQVVLGDEFGERCGSARIPPLQQVEEEVLLRVVTLLWKAREVFVGQQQEPPSTGAPPRAGAADPRADRAARAVLPCSRRSMTASDMADHCSPAARPCRSPGSDLAGYIACS
jgi:hypothetical protein